MLIFQSADSKSRKKNALEIILKKEEFSMYAATEREKDEWVGQIGKAIVKHSGMYVDEDDGDDEEDDKITKK